MAVLMLLAVLLVYPYSTGQDTALVEQIMTHVPPLALLPPRQFEEGHNDKLVEAARHQFPLVNGIPEAQVEAIYLALYYYPELASVPIEFVFGPINTTMATRPAPNSYLRRAGRRTYRVFINDKPGFEGILFQHIPLNGRVGIVAHELSHVLDYEQRSSLGIIGVGLRFLNKRGRAGFERTIDLLTIYKGMGWQLRDWAWCAMGGCPGATPAYQAFKRGNYLPPEEVEKEINSMALYRR